MFFFFGESELYLHFESQGLGLAPQKIFDMRSDPRSHNEVSEKAVPSKIKIPEPKSSRVKRAFGNMFEVRVCSAISSSTTATIKLHSTLSPWGDNNPLVIPAVKASDVISCFLPFGYDIFDGLLDVSLDGLGHCLKLARRHNHHQAEAKALIQDKIKAEADSLAERITREEEVVLPQPQGIKTIKMKVKHKLIGTTANISLVSERPRPAEKAERRLSSHGKGWFCPYLYCTGRKAHIRRAQDFSIAGVKGPGALKADRRVAHRLLAESPSLLALCDPEPSAVVGSPARMIILFVGMSPRRMWLWSQSR